jgi:hypothetical protein
VSLPRYTPGKPKPARAQPPHGQSVKTLTVKVKAHTRKITPHQPANPLDAPVTPGSSVTVRQAQRMAANATQVRYGGQEQGLGQQIATQGQVGRDQQDWYRQYLAQLAQYQQDTQNRAAATNTAVQQQADSIRTLDQGQLSQQQQAMQADAANRGATLDPSVANRASQASVVRQALEGGLGALIAARGQSASTQASNLAHVVGPIQQGQAQAASARQQQTLQGQLTGLKGTEGAYKQSFIDSLTGNEAKNILAASIASGRDLTAQTRVKETVRHNKASEKIASNNPAKAKTKAELAFFNKHGYFPPTGPPKKVKGPAAGKPVSGPGSLSPIKEASIVSQIHQIISFIQSAPKQDSKGVKLTDHELRTRLMNGSNPLGKAVDSRIINIAFDVARNGGLSAPNVRAAHDLGIHVSGHFKKLAATPKSTVKPGIFTGGDNPFLTP